MPDPVVVGQVISVTEFKGLLGLLSILLTIVLGGAGMWMKMIHGDLRALKVTLTDFCTATQLQQKDIEQLRKDIDETKIEVSEIGTKTAALHRRLDKSGISSAFDTGGAST